MLPFAAAFCALLAYLCASARVCSEALRGIGGGLLLRAGVGEGCGLTALTALLDQMFSEVQSSIHPLSPSVEPMALSMALSSEETAMEPMALYAELAVRVSSASNKLLLMQPADQQRATITRD